jgi:small membrane protein
MIAFQVIGILAAAIFVALTLWRLGRRRISPASAFAWVVLWSAAALAIAVPESTAVAARVLGIQRGADLVFYCGILGTMAGFFLVYSRLRRLEREITLLTRRLALREADAEGPTADGEAASGGAR